MAITLRSTSALAYGNRANSTVTAPTGHAANDVIIVALECGGSTLVEPTGPAGWELLARIDFSASDPWAVDLSLWAKVRDGASSWTWTHTSHSTQAFVMCLTGVDNTTMLDAPIASVRQLEFGGSTTITVPSVTTSVAGVWSAIIRGSWDGNAITPPTGWTERYDAPVLWVGTREWAAVGATGTTTLASGNGGAAAPWGALHVPLRPAGAGGTAASGAGTLSLSGAADVGAEASAAGALSIVGAGSATAAGAAAGAGVLALSGTAGAATVVVGAGSLSLSGSAGASTPVVASPVTMLVRTHPPVVTGKTTVTGGGPVTITVTTHPPVVTGSSLDAASASGSLSLTGAAGTAGTVEASGVLSITGVASTSGAGSASGVLSLSGAATPEGSEPVSAAGALDLSGGGAAQIGEGGQGFLSLTGQSGVVAPSSATGQVVLLGAAGAGARLVADGVLNLGGFALVGVAQEATAVGSLSLSGTAVLVRPPNYENPVGVLRRNGARGVIRTGRSRANIKRNSARGRMRT